MNIYEQRPDKIIDLHRYTLPEVEILLDDLLHDKPFRHVRIITGKGNHSKNGPVIRSFVKEYLQLRNIRFNQSKIQDGGEGALEVFL